MRANAVGVFLLLGACQPAASPEANASVAASAMPVSSTICSADEVLFSDQSLIYRVGHDLFAMYEGNMASESFAAVDFITTAPGQGSGTLLGYRDKNGAHTLYMLSSNGITRQLTLDVPPGFGLTKQDFDLWARSGGAQPLRFYRRHHLDYRGGSGPPVDDPVLDVPLLQYRRTEYRSLRVSVELEAETDAITSVYGGYNHLWLPDEGATFWNFDDLSLPGPLMHSSLQPHLYRDGHRAGSLSLGPTTPYGLPEPVLTNDATGRTGYLLKLGYAPDRTDLVSGFLTVDGFEPVAQASQSGDPVIDNSGHWIGSLGGLEPGRLILFDRSVDAFDDWFVEMASVSAGEARMVVRYSDRYERQVGWLDLRDPNSEVHVLAHCGSAQHPTTLATSPEGGAEAIEHALFEQTNAGNASGSLVVHVHGGPAASTPDNIPSLIQTAARNGSDVLIVNYRGSSGQGKWMSLGPDTPLRPFPAGENEPVRIWTASEMAQDVTQAILAATRRRHYSTVIVSGESFGALLSLLAISRSQNELPVSCAILTSPLLALSPYEDYFQNRFGADAANILLRMDAGVEQYEHRLASGDFIWPDGVPLMIIQGMRDDITPDDLTRAFVSEVMRAGRVEPHLYELADGEHRISTAHREAFDEAYESCLLPRAPN